MHKPNINDSINPTAASSVGPTVSVPPPISLVDSRVKPSINTNILLNKSPKEASNFISLNNANNSMYTTIKSPSPRLLKESDINIHSDTPVAAPV